MWAFDFAKAQDENGQVLEPDTSPANIHDVRLTRKAQPN